MNADPRFWKFTVSSRIPFNFVSAKRFTPRIENIRMIRKSKLPILAIAGRLVKNVIRVLLRDLFFLKIKRILTVLKDRIIVACGPKLSSLIWLTMRPTTEATTIMISKMFHGSRKYLQPKPISLIMSSKIKMTVSVKLMLSIV
jgi:hypothetical protein